MSCRKKSTLFLVPFFTTWYFPVLLYQVLDRTMEEKSSIGIDDYWKGL